MKFALQSVCAALACQSIASFAPQYQYKASTSTSFLTTSSSRCNIGIQHAMTMDQQNKGLFMTNTNDAENIVKADDGAALQGLFASHCDEDGLMTKATLQTDISAIKELLAIGDLLQEELDDIWNAAPKFPDIDASNQRIDVDSFIQIYRDIDDIFEDQGSDDETPAVVNEEETDDDSDMEDPEEARDEKELEQAFKTICDNAGLVSKDALKNWSEVKEMLDENELGEDEFDEMWERTAKSPGSPEQIDVDGFLSFNVALDDLFVFDDLGDDAPSSDAPAQIAMFYADDLPPGVIFAEIADENLLVGMDELKTWGDLQDMLREGELLPLELQNVYEGISKAAGTDDKLNEEGFVSLYEAIEALFEEVDEDEEDGVQSEPAPAPEAAPVPVQQAVVSSKANFLKRVSQLGMDEDRLPCGLDSTDNEVELMLEMASALEMEASNKISADADIQTTDVSGDWEMIYTTSSTMKFNQGLSGLVPPNGKFARLTQKLSASKYLADAEYVELISAGPTSFEVKVTGDWEIRSSVSLFTGSKSVCLNVEPDKVNYGLKIQKADHWKSLGPLTLLDISYLDEDLRIMRGTTSTDSIFVFKRI